MSYPVTNSLQVVKELQWVKEATRGTTPNSPTFAAIPTRTFSPKPTVENIKYRKLGSPDLYKGIKLREMYDFGITYAPIDTNLLKYMVNIGATPSRDDSFTFVISQKHNSSNTLVEQYQIVKGASISDLTITVASGDIITVDSNWIANSISDWSTTSGLTGATFASALTATPWSPVNTGASPFTWDTGGTPKPYDVRSFKCGINHNPDRIQVVGQSQTTWINPTTREISLDMDVVWKDTSLQADTKTLTARNMTMQINSVTPTTLTFTDAYLESYDETVDAESTDAKVTSYSGFAASVSVN